MASRVEKEMNDLRFSLEKAIADSNSSEETINDLLTALSKLPISIELLKATKIGQTLQDTKNKFNGTDIGTQTKTLISKWKKDCASNTSSSAATATTNTTTSKVSGDTISRSSSASSSEPARGTNVSAEVEDDSEEHYNNLPPMRKTVNSHSYLLY